MDIDIPTLRQTLEHALVQLVSQGDAYTNATFMPACRHALLAGGKRIRPILTCLIANALNASQEQDAFHAALAIECLHNYTLIHDDLPAMDNDTLRRGEPTVWAKFGEAQAILAGDYLQALAFAEIGRCSCAHKLLPIFAQGALDVIHGQVADIHAATVDKATWDRPLLDYIFLKKTARLIATACEMGAITAQASEPLQAAAKNYGTQLGIAFQLIDDLLDAEQSTDGNEFTALALMTKDELRKYAAQTTQSAIDALRIFPDSPAKTALCALATDLLSRVL